MDTFFKVWHVISRTAHVMSNFFTLFNLFFAFEVLLSMIIFVLVYFQQNYEDLSSQPKLSAPSSKTDDMIKFTYLTITLFVFNTLLLNVLYKREQKAYQVSESHEKQSLSQDDLDQKFPNPQSEPHTTSKPKRTSRANKKHKGKKS